MSYFSKPNFREEMKDWTLQETRKEKEKQEKLCEYRGRYGRDVATSHQSQATMGAITKEKRQKGF